MSNTAFSFRRRTFGRAPSPPTWACYEQIPLEDDESATGSEDESCSEDDEDYAQDEHDGDCGCGCEPSVTADGGDSLQIKAEDADNVSMDIVNDGKCSNSDSSVDYEIKKDIKGKQRAVEPQVIDNSPKQRQRRRKHREPVYTLRPILTIQKSQGFVWNQDLFVPPYIKDRYVASTSPPNSTGFISANGSVNSMTDYEIEVVEIRVKEGELADIIP